MRIDASRQYPGFGHVLKIALFATGCAGIVAEFVLSTLATYLIGNAIFQWTIVMSVMLFAMGIGSRASRWFRGTLLDSFIMVEFSLSVLCAMSAMLAYGIAAYTLYTDLVIYVMAFAVGSLIGLEIPLVTRLNEDYEELRINISGVMEKDYYGALAGGLLFAFFALPKLGLTYTPIILGTVNFFVASLILWRFHPLLQKKRLLVSLFGITLVVLAALAILAKPVVLYGEQKKYKDKIVYSQQTVYQKIVMTQWKSDYWLFINGQEQFSTFDEEKYHEPLVHPAMKTAHDPKHILVLGGGDGLAVREILKHAGVESVTLVDLDPTMTDLAKNHPTLTAINQGSMNDPRVRIVNEDARKFLDRNSNLFDVIIADLPDPDSIDLMHVYSEGFYLAVGKSLVRGGVFVTQATSPYFSKKAFLCLMKTIRKAGFSILPYHNQVPTMGEWGWIIAADAAEIDEPNLKQFVLSKSYEDVETRFVDKDAVISMLHFGKGVLDDPAMADIKVNTKMNPVLYRYFMAGSWGVY